MMMEDLWYWGSSTFVGACVVCKSMDGTDLLCCFVLCCAVLCACSMRLLQNTSRGIGDLILIYKRMTGLAGHTSRVAELLEQVRDQKRCAQLFDLVAVVCLRCLTW